MMKVIKERLVVIGMATLLAMPAMANDAEEAELARQEAFRFGMKAIVDDLNVKWFDSFFKAIDRDDMIDRIYGLRLIDQNIKRSFAEKLDYTWEPLLANQFGDTEKDGLKATLLGVESRGTRGRAVVRLDLPKLQFNYHEYELVLDDNGRMRIVDWINYSNGQAFAEGMGQYLVASMPSHPAMRKLLDFKNVSETELFQFGELLKASRDNKLDRYLEILDDLPEKFHRQRIVVETTVHLARNVRKRREYLDGLEKMAEFYPNEPLYALMLIDHYLPKRMYDEADTALVGAYRKMGFDDAAMEARLSAVALVKGDPENAKTRAERALELEVDLELAWWSALNARVTLGDFPGSVLALDRLEEEFGYELDAKMLGRDPKYRELLASTEFATWREGR